MDDATILRLLDVERQTVADTGDLSVRRQARVFIREETNRIVLRSLADYIENEGPFEFIFSRECSHAFIPAHC
jgi:uncharacterized protein YfaS (alpha-2-macroglobulin family)